MIKLIAVNVQTTLLDNNGKFNRQKFQKIVDKMKNKGIHLVIISDDNYPHLLRFFSSIDGNISYICENGAQVINNGVVLKDYLIDNLTCRRLVQYVVRNDDMKDANIILSGKNNAYTNLSSSDDKFKNQKQYYNYLQPVPDISAVFDQIYRIHLEWPHGNDFMREQLIDRKFPNLQILSNVHGGMDVITSEVNRKNDLSILQKAFNSANDETAFFSFDNNDQQVLASLKHGISLDKKSGDVLDQINQLLK